MDPKDEVLEAASRHLGDFDVVADRSWKLNLAVVLEVVSSGKTMFVKGHAESRRFRTEVSAYQDVVPAIMVFATLSRRNRCAASLVCR